MKYLHFVLFSLSKKTVSDSLRAYSHADLFDVFLFQIQMLLEHTHFVLFFLSITDYYTCSESIHVDLYSLGV